MFKHTNLLTAFTSLCSAHASRCGSRWWL